MKTNITEILNTTEGGDNTVDAADISQNKSNNESISCPSLTDIEISTESAVEQFISGIKIWKETTSTSPSGRHLGHYKAIIRDETWSKYLQQ